MHAPRHVEVPRQLYGHWTYGGLWLQTVGDQTGTGSDDRAARDTAKTRVDDGGRL